MKYWLYKLKDESSDIIKIDYLTEDVSDDDLFIVHKGGELVGAYKKYKENLTREQKLSGKLSNFYDKLSIIEFVNDRTYKVFSKKLKEITKEDYEVLKCA